MGQIADAIKNPNTFAPDPKGFSGTEWLTRFAGGAGKGALQGFQNQQNENRSMPGGGGMPGPMAYVPQTQQPNFLKLLNQGGGGNPFYGGS